jgi:PST family polysaccharide transporter
MAEKNETTSHGEALKSSAVIGGSTAIVLLIRMIRTKVLAVLLGPVGIGLEAIYDSITNLAKTASDLGVSSSGVRQIAAAVGTGDQPLITRTIVTLRRVCVILGVVGTAVLFFAREWVSQIAFGTPDHAFDIGLLAIAILFARVMGGQMALLQGMRRIRELAKVNILGALVGTVVSIPIVYVWGRDGIAAYLTIVAGAGVLISWIFARRVRIDPVNVSFRDIGDETRNLLRLGLAFVSSGLMTVGALFLSRIFVVRQEGVEGAGEFQAASALSMVYIGFILQAMGTDFYPRLAAMSEDDKRCNQLVNEQAEVSMLLGLPGILATIALAPWVIQLFYSNKFGAASEILCWQAAGMVLRVGSWPMGYIVVAKGRSAVLFWTELAAHSTYAVLAWIGLRTVGLRGVGMAFLAMYIFHWCMMYVVARKMTGFSWSGMNWRLSSIAVLAMAMALVVRLSLKDPWATSIGCALAFVAGCYCLTVLVGLVGREKIEHYLGRIGLPMNWANYLWGRRPAAPVAGD